MKLKDRALTDPLDVQMERYTRESWREKVRSGNLRGGIARHAIFMGGDSPMFYVETFGEEEFFVFAVYLAKIRRENPGIAQATPERQHQWYEMTKQFIAEFGDRAPPDVRTDCDACRRHLGL